MACAMDEFVTQLVDGSEQWIVGEMAGFRRLRFAIYVDNGRSKLRPSRAMHDDWGVPLYRPHARLTSFGGYFATAAMNCGPPFVHFPEMRPYPDVSSHLPTTIYPLPSTNYPLPSTNYCATVGFSAITSANVVGYATDTLAQNKFVIKAIQFEDVASGKVNANTVLSGFTGVDFDNASAFMLTAPQILVQSTAGYNTYFYLNDAYIEATDSTKQGWADGDGNYVEPKVAVGSGFWVKSNDKMNITFNP
mgnify:CR=1 FL=1